MASASVPAPVPFAIARSMLSFGMLASLAFWTASASAAFDSGSPPPSRAATWIARASFVNCAPRRWSTTAFLCLIDAHFEWPDMGREDRPGLVERGLRRGRLRGVSPREPPQLAPLRRAQALALQDDRLDLVEGGAALDALAERRPNLLVHRIPFPSPSGVPSAEIYVPEMAGRLTHAGLDEYGAARGTWAILISLCELEVAHVREGDAAEVR